MSASWMLGNNENCRFDRVAFDPLGASNSGVFLRCVERNNDGVQKNVAPFLQTGAVIVVRVANHERWQRALALVFASCINVVDELACCDSLPKDTNHSMPRCIAVRLSRRLAAAVLAPH